jgi:hypothetical protein
VICKLSLPAIYKFTVARAAGCCYNQNNQTKPFLFLFLQFIKGERVGQLSKRKIKICEKGKDTCIINLVTQGKKGDKGHDCNTTEAIRKNKACTTIAGKKTICGQR